MAKSATKLLVLYSFMGIFTTSLFLGTEYVFHFLFTTDFMRYVSTIIGLAVGYFIECRLDKHFVFSNRHVGAFAL